MTVNSQIRMPQVLTTVFLQVFASFLFVLSDQAIAYTLRQPT